MTVYGYNADGEFVCNIEVATNVCVMMDWKVVPGHLLPDGYDRRLMTKRQEQEKAWNSMACPVCGAKRLEPCFCNDPKQRKNRWARR